MGHSNYELTTEQKKQIYNEGYSNAIEDVQKILHDVHQNYDLKEEYRESFNTLIPVLSEILKESAQSIKNK